MLAHLGYNTQYLGTFADTPESEWICQSMIKDGVNVDGCPMYPDHVCPNSVVISNITSGTRTIVHTNLGLPELSLENFKNLDLNKFRNLKSLNAT